jgi:type I protein arginine methyltransferase
MELPFEFEVNKTGVCHGLAAWFSVLFDGTDIKTILSTGPHDAGTHWYSCRLLLRDPIAVNAKQRLAGKLIMKANTRYSYDLTLEMKIKGSGATTSDGVDIASAGMMRLQDQLYHY